MIGLALDKAIGVLAPAWQLRRMQARKLIRSYKGAESNRLNANTRPRNLPADLENSGKDGADMLRARARMLVRDNAYAWGVVDTIVSSVVGCGITAQSTFETSEGDDIENINDARDKLFMEWCEVCDINGRLCLSEMQALAQREICEAGEVLIRVVKTPKKEYRGIYRPVPLALELIEADRLAGDKDTYTAGISKETGARIVRGVEVDELGKPIAYWIYKDHPLQPYAVSRTPERIPASEILHLYRQDRIGQTRGVSWFAPVLSWLFDLGVYVDNELQASAVASCFTVAIKSDSPVGSLLAPEGENSTDADGNTYDYLQPGMIMRLRTNESIESANPGRPNSASEPWISLMLRGIAVGTGLSYEIVARDYSKTSYSSSRTSQLEDRRRFRRWQRYLLNHMLQPIWDAFCDAAAISGVEYFPTSAELLEDRRKYAPVEWQTPEWEWVDPQSEQQSSQAAISSFMSDYQTELGSRGRSWRSVFYQRAKEEKLRQQLGLVTAEEKIAAMNTPGGGSPQQPQVQTGTGEMSETSRLQWQRNRKAIEDVLTELKDGTMSPAKASAMLSTLGLAQPTIDALIADAADGTIDNPLPEATA